METIKDSKQFGVSGKNGNVVQIIAEKGNVIALGSVERQGPWSFRTEDGKPVRDSGDGSLIVDPDGEGTQVTVIDDDKDIYRGLV